jgi:transcriptional regulator with XRE-family HTH domain
MSTTTTTTTTPTASTTSELVGLTKVAISELIQQAEAVPDSRDATSDREKERRDIERQTLLAKASHLRRVLLELQAVPDVEALDAWATVLQMAWDEFSAEFNAPPADTVGDDVDSLRARERRHTQLGQALTILRTGPEVFPSGEFLPPALIRWFEAHGVQPVDGKWFNSRGGIRRTETQLADALRRRAIASDQLTHYLEQYTNSAVVPG